VKAGAKAWRLTELRKTVTLLTILDVESADFFGNFDLIMVLCNLKFEGVFQQSV